MSSASDKVRRDARRSEKASTPETLIERWDAVQRQQDLQQNEGMPNQAALAELIDEPETRDPTDTPIVLEEVADDELRIADGIAPDAEQATPVALSESDAISDPAETAEPGPEAGPEASEPEPEIQAEAPKADLPQQQDSKQDAPSTTEADDTPATTESKADGDEDGTPQPDEPKPPTAAGVSYNMSFGAPTSVRRRSRVRNRSAETGKPPTTESKATESKATESKATESKATGAKATQPPPQKQRLRLRDGTRTAACRQLAAAIRQGPAKPQSPAQATKPAKPAPAAPSPATPDTAGTSEASTPNLQPADDDAKQAAPLALSASDADRLPAELPEKTSHAPVPVTVNDVDDMEYARYGRSIFVGMLLLIVGLGGFIAWASLAPLSSGVVASGFVKLQGERKTLQHLEGGIIDELLVREGDAVEEGQVLLRLDGSQAESVFEVANTEYHTLLAMKSRLLSERNRQDDVSFDPELLALQDDADVSDLIRGERTLFADRKANHQDQIKIFASSIEGFKREIAGLEAERTAARTQLGHIKDELQAVETLYNKGIVSKPRLLELKRTAAGLVGRIGALTANIARAEQRISETELRRVALETDRTEQISDQLTQVENSIRRVKEQLPAQRDIVERLEIRAPRSGRVVNLRYHTPGGVITPSTGILDIVPKDERLLIEAQVAPVDIDILKPGMDAQITLTAYSMRKTPPVAGKLLQVSADRIEDPKTGEPHYLALVEIDPDALAELEGVTLYPGMPTSVQFVGGERTPLDYLLSPIEAGLRNSWLEE